MQRRAGLYVIGAGAAVSLWGGWVGLGGLSGFGEVQLLPGIWDSFRLNTAITLPLSLEAYGMVALGFALDPKTARRPRRFALKTGIASFVVGMIAQATFHLLTSHHAAHAPWPVIVAVSWVPVVMLGLASVLYHMAGQEDPEAEGAPGPVPSRAELFDQMRGTITPAPRPAPAPVPWPDEPLPTGTVWLAPELAVLPDPPEPVHHEPESVREPVPDIAAEADALFGEPAAGLPPVPEPKPAAPKPPARTAPKPAAAKGRLSRAELLAQRTAGLPVPRPVDGTWTPEAAGLTEDEARRIVAALPRNDLVDFLGVSRGAASRIKEAYGAEPALAGAR